MSWLDRWSRTDRTVADLSGAAPRPGAIADPRLIDVAVRERTAAIVARSVDDPRLSAVASSVLARQVLALTDAGEAIRAIGPDVIPLKGLHLIESVYAPGERDLGDLDLLVARDRVSAADSALRRIGYESEGDVRRVFGATGLYRNSELYRRGESFPVHLHWHVVNASLPLFMIRIRVEEIWGESRAATVAGAPARLMATHHLLVTLCEHALKHSYDTLIHLADIDRVWRSGVDAAAAFSAARRWGVESALRWGLHFAGRILGTPVDVRPPRGLLSRLIERSMRENVRWAGLGAMGYLAMAEGWRGKARFLRATFAPPAGEVETFGKRPGWRNVARRAWAAVSTVLSAT